MMYLTLTLYLIKILTQYILALDTSYIHLAAAAAKKKDDEKAAKALREEDAVNAAVAKKKEEAAGEYQSLTDWY